MLSDALLEQIIEGALLASGQTLSVDRIQNLFEEGQEPEKERILIILERIGEKCENKGYELKKVATGYRFQVKQDIAKWVSRLWEEKPQRYSRALLETLSIIAYRQPVTRGEIEDVRGVAVSSHITKTLVEREWIQVVGHRDVPGRPAMYATTKMFLDYFNLESLDQLPTLEEIQEIADANHALELEDKSEEGNFDLSVNMEEQGDSENLQSAAEDLAAAEAIVQQVEDNVFNKPEEDEEAEGEAEVESESTPDMLDSEQQVTAADEQVFEESDAARDAEKQNADMSEEELAEATIARMIAEQEALLQKSTEERGEAPVTAAPSSSGTATVTPEESQSAVPATLEAEDDELSGAPSVFGSAPDDDEEALAAAMEEEMIAQLEAEQEALLEEQDKEDGEKTLSDLANKFD
jgi:segregation and condensation protein B